MERVTWETYYSTMLIRIGSQQGFAHMSQEDSTGTLYQNQEEVGLEGGKVGRF